MNKVKKCLLLSTLVACAASSFAGYGGALSVCVDNTLSESMIATAKIVTATNMTRYMSFEPKTFTVGSGAMKCAIIDRFSTNEASDNVTATMSLTASRVDEPTKVYKHASATFHIYGGQHKILMDNMNSQPEKYPEFTLGHLNLAGGRGQNGDLNINTIDLIPGVVDFHNRNMSYDCYDSWLACGVAVLGWQLN